MLMCFREKLQLRVWIWFGSWAKLRNYIPKWNWEHVSTTGARVLVLSSLLRDWWFSVSLLHEGRASSIRAATLLADERVVAFFFMKSMSEGGIFNRTLCRSYLQLRWPQCVKKPWQRWRNHAIKEFKEFSVRWWGYCLLSVNPKTNKQKMCIGAICPLLAAVVSRWQTVMAQSCWLTC